MAKALDARLQRALIDNAHDVLGVLDSAGNIVFESAEIADALGYDPEELLGQNAYELVHPDDVSRVELAAAKLTPGGPPQQLKYRFAHKHGGYRMLDGRARLAEGGDGNTYLVFACRDVTDIDATDAQRRELEQRFQGLVEAAPDAVVVFVDGEIVMANKAAGDMLGGANADSLLGMRNEQLIHPDDLQATLDRVDRLMAGNTLQPMERRTRRADGQYIWTEGLGRAITWQGQPAVLAVVRDISDRRAAAEALERANTDLRAANFELTQFAEIATHDLQEPLRTITSFIQLLAKHAGPQIDDTGRSYIDEALGGVKRLQALLDDLRDFTQVGAGDVADTPVSTVQALGDAQAALAGQLEQSGAQITHDNLPTVMGDAKLITQVFTQLLSNAIKYAKEGQPPQVHVSADWRYSRWCIAVRDQGIGIAPEHQTKIFEIFRRLHTQDVRPGTGVGLATVRRILERHGGRIWVESAPGEGSTFVFTLPPGGPGKATS